MRIKELEDMAFNTSKTPVTPSEIYALGAALRERDGRLANQLKAVIC